MNKVSVNMQHCFGIESLEYEFDFTDDSTYAIYARNGLMKTSFAKTFQKIQQGKRNEIADVIFGENGNAEIKVDGNDMEQQDVFVVKSFETSYESDISSLLVKGEIKQQLQNVLKAREKFLKEIVKLSGVKLKSTSAGKIKYELENTIIKDFEFIEHSILLNLNTLAEQMAEIDCASISYSSIFDATTIKKLQSSEFQNSIQNFVTASEQIYESYDFLEKGKLTFPKLKDLKKALDKDSFFVKNNKLFLSGTDEIPDANALNERIEAIENSIKAMPELKSIEGLLTDAKGMQLKDVIETNPEIVPYLSIDNLDTLKKSLWISYIKAANNLFEDLKTKYNQLSTAIDEIDLDNTPWKDALDIFNKRFTVPFKMTVSNLKGAIIGESLPQIEFSFEKDNRTVCIDRSKLDELDTLSQGEKRALYLLNIIFDIEQIKVSNRETLLVIDDIADSFDYKNKYAIIEYLCELEEEPNIKMIILSHNYDFYRTISSRIPVNGNNRLFADTSLTGIELIREKYQKQPFEFWKKNPYQKFVLALIPFVRNLVDYGKERNISGNDNQADYLLLTSLLHEKGNTNQISFADIQPVYEEYMGITLFKDDVVLLDKVVPTLLNVCNQITNADSTLENKIILAMGIRHKAEQIMIYELNAYTGQLFWNKNREHGNSEQFLQFVATRGNQTRELMNGYNQIGDDITKKVMAEVNLMTPENIHLNAFMYEPILDMDIVELLNLYGQVQDLVVREE
ncbi:MAG: hypothetical protein RSE60_02765 [Erysipelotrichaceae bacterium]